MNPRALQSPGLATLAGAFLAVAAAAQEPRAGLKGKVTGATVDARIRVTVWRNDMRRDVVTPIAEGFATPDGAFAFANVPWIGERDWGFNTVVVVAWAGKRVGLQEFRGRDLPSEDLRIKVADAIDLHGQLRDAVTAQPIPNAWVWPAIFGSKNKGRAAAWVTEPLLPWHATTDADGRFTLRGLPPLAPFKLMAGGPDHARTWVDAEDPGQPVQGELPLGGRIRGVVLLPDGKPATRVRVRACGRGAGYGDATTGDAGEFEITSLAADLYKVFAEVDDLTVIACVDLDVQAGGVVEDQKVQLVHGGFIVGRIVDKATGKPIVPGDHTDVAMYGPARGDGGACECTPVLPDGTFRIRAPAGRNRIYLRAANGYDEPSEHVEVVEGQETKVEWQVSRPTRK